MYSLDEYQAEGRERIWLPARKDRSVLLPRGAFEPLNTAVD